MTVKDALKHNLNFCREILMGYIKDLNDADLFLRPTPTTNHIAWQLGHMIVGENFMIASVGGKMPELPSGFTESYTKETSTSNDPKKFHTKSQYIDLLEKNRKATLAAVDASSEADFSKPSHEKMRAYAPTVFAVYHLVGSHELMHAGQFVPVRRQLGKPALF